MNKKIFLLGALIVFFLSLFFAVRTYSRYYTRISISSATIQSANWHFEANDEETSFIINLGYLYPGVDQSFNVELSSVGSEVPIDYTITFGNPVSIPAKLNFYSDSTKQHSINLNGGTITGEMGANTTKTVTIYYDWTFAGAEQASSGTSSFTISVDGRQKNPNS